MINLHPCFQKCCTVFKSPSRKKKWLDSLEALTRMLKHTCIYVLSNTALVGGKKEAVSRSRVGCTHDLQGAVGI